MHTYQEYLELYCEKYQLKIEDLQILNRKRQVVGSFKSENDNYVFFEECGLMKKSDLFLALLDNLSVH
tara:strand:- start:113 stop:316 length:204 start_codon:yes stop_codon:yes gene_type:complete